MAIYYANIDTSYTGTGHAGTTLDPFSWDDMYGALPTATNADTFNIRGMRETTSPFYQTFNNPLLTSWNLTTYGPWRVKFTELCELRGLSLSNAIITTDSNHEVDVYGTCNWTNVYSKSLGFAVDAEGSHVFTNCTIIYKDALINSYNDTTFAGSAFHVSGQCLVSVPDGATPSYTMDNCAINISRTQFEQYFDVTALSKINVSYKRLTWSANMSTPVEWDYPTLSGFSLLANKGAQFV